MELHEMTLKEYISIHKKRTKKMKLKQKLSLMTDMSDGLTTFHITGYAHRGNKLMNKVILGFDSIFNVDIKPENIFKRKKKCRCVLGDFGLTKKVDDMRSLLGTNEYNLFFCLLI